MNQLNYKMTILKTWKYIGETPLQAMTRALKDYKEDHEKACYAGRLDPMAQGIMVILVKQPYFCLQDYYNSCIKTYRFQAILGISTSSYDPMGNIQDVTEITGSQVIKYNDNMLKLKGKINQAFPPCSSVRHKGKPLWWHAKHGSLPVILPFKEREIYSIKSLNNPIETTLKEYKKLSIGDMQDVENLNPGVFNTVDFIKEWNSLDVKIKIWKLQYEVTVSAGTYVRSLVKDIGQQLNIPAHAFRITRISTCTEKIDFIGIKPCDVKI